jgi:GH24 family phage-related lysozyme (muramidase)
MPDNKIAVREGADEMSLSDRLIPGIFLEELRESLPPGVSLRKTFMDGVTLTKVSEGFINHAYDDPVGFCTIAYGHLIDKKPCRRIPLEPQFRGKISEPAGEGLLVKDMEIAEVAVQNALKNEPRDGEFAALVDFVFNVGVTNFKKSTLLKKVNQGKYQDIPYEFRKWTLAGKSKTRLPGLVKRREAEIALYFAGSMAEVPATEPTAAELIDIRTGETTP